MELGSRPGSAAAELLQRLLTSLQLATLLLYLPLGPGLASEGDRKTAGQVLCCVMETVMEDTEWEAAEGWGYPAPSQGGPGEAG